MIIRQRLDDVALGNKARVMRVLRVEERLYVEVWQTIDATEPTLMRAVNAAVSLFAERTKNRRGYGSEEGYDGCL